MISPSCLVLLILTIAPVRNVDAVRSPRAIGRWEKIPAMLREVGATRVVVGDDRTVWVGTSNGLFAYGDRRQVYPSFVAAEDRSVIIVNDLLPLPGGVLVGTINGSIWLATRERMEKIVDLGDQSNHAFARLPDGTLLIANSFGRLKPEHLAPWRDHLPKVHVIPGEAGQPAILGRSVVLVNQYGRIEKYDPPTGRRLHLGDLDLPQGVFARSVAAGADGRLYVGSDRACILTHIDIERGLVHDTQELVPGKCTAILEEDPTRLWVGGVHGLFLHDGREWCRWSRREGLDFGVIGGIARDDAGNLWVGGNGLFQHFDYFREVPIDPAGAEPARVVEDGEGGAYISLSDGRVSHVSSNGRCRPLAVGPTFVPGENSSAGYYRGALISLDRNRTLWVLNHNGLFRVDRGEISRVADYPVDKGQVTTMPAVSFAVHDAEHIFCGQMWTAKVLHLAPSGWETALETPMDSGGNSVPAMEFDPAGRLWVVGTTTAYVLEEGRWTELGRFEILPDVKKNLYGAIAIQDALPGAFIFGPWGYSIFSGRRCQVWETRRVGRSDDPGQPWLFHRIIHHTRWGMLAATDQGLYRWDRDVWRPEAEIDPRLGWSIRDIAPGVGTAFWILGDSFWRVEFPGIRPSVVIEEAPPAVSPSTDVRLSWRAKDVQGPQALWRYRVKIVPAVVPYGDVQDSQRSEYVLTGLSDGGQYRYEVAVEDAFGNASDPIVRSFRVEVPWRKNPAKFAGAVSAIITLGLLLSLVALTRRGPTGYLLRVWRGRRWQFVGTGVDLTLEIESPEPGALTFRLQAPGRMATVLPRVRLRASALDVDRLKQDLSLIAEAVRRQGQTMDASDRVAQLIQDVGRRCAGVLDEAVRFLCEQVPTAKLQLILGDVLLDIPWELWRLEDGDMVSLRHSVGRQVGSASTATKDPGGRRDLVAVVFAPDYAPSGRSSPLSNAAWEASRVRHRLATWGARVRVLDGRASCQEVLEAIRDCHIFHFVGHTCHDDQDPASSGLLIRDSAISAAQLHREFQEHPSPMLLAFINGCSSAQEGAWNPGRAVFGLASPFLRDSTYFIGAQWPVHDGFSWELADRFYYNVFPSGRGLWWRWLRNRDLAGIPLAEALRRARRDLSRRPRAGSTWPAYVFYGNPSARIEWR
jgi:hypothetical protein